MSREDGKYGIFTALIRFVFMWNWKKARGIKKAADELFTKDAEGIEAGYDIEKDRLIKSYRDMEGAVSRLDMLIEEKKIALEDEEAKFDKAVKRRDGALAAAKRVRKQIGEGHENDPEFKKHSEAFIRYTKEVKAIEARQQSLQADIDSQKPIIEKYMLQLTELQAKIKKLEEEKNITIAEFTSSQEIIKLNQRLSGMINSMDEGPIEAIRKAVKESSARARVSSRLQGTDAAYQDAQYEKAADDAEAAALMKELLDADEAAEQTSQGEKPAVETEEERPEI